MKSKIVKRSIVLGSHNQESALRTSSGAEDIAVRRRMSLLLGSVHSERKHGNLSSTSLFAP